MVSLVQESGRALLHILDDILDYAKIEAGHLAITPALFRKLSPAARQLFKKHTPPISYIDVEAPRPRA